jgi:urea transporter
MKKLLLKLWTKLTPSHILLAAIAIIISLMFGSILTGLWALLISIVAIFLSLLIQEGWQYITKTGDYKL